MSLNNSEKQTVQEAIVNVYEDYLGDSTIPKKELTAAISALQSVSEILLAGDNLDWHRHQVHLRKKGIKTTWEDSYDEKDYINDGNEAVVIMINGKEVGRFNSSDVNEKFDVTDLESKNAPKVELPEKSSTDMKYKGRRKTWIM